MACRFVRGRHRSGPRVCTCKRRNHRDCLVEGICRQSATEGRAGTPACNRRAGASGEVRLASDRNDKFGSSENLSGNSIFRSDNLELRTENPIFWTAASRSICPNRCLTGSGLKTHCAKLMRPCGPAIRTCWRLSNKCCLMVRLLSWMSSVIARLPIIVARRWTILKNRSVLRQRVLMSARLLVRMSPRRTRGLLRHEAGRSCCRQPGDVGCELYSSNWCQTRSTDFPPAFPESAKNTASAIAISGETNPQILAAAVNVEQAAEANIGVRKSDLLPKVNFEAGYLIDNNSRILLGEAERVLFKAHYPSQYTNRVGLFTNTRSKANFQPTQAGSS